MRSLGTSRSDPASLGRSDLLLALRGDCHALTGLPAQQLQCLLTTPLTATVRKAGNVIHHVFSDDDASQLGKVLSPLSARPGNTRTVEQPASVRPSAGSRGGNS